MLVVRLCIVCALCSDGANSPPAAKPGQTFALVECGGQHCCALSTDQDVVCWGSNNQGVSNLNGYAIHDSFYSSTSGGATGCSGCAAAAHFNGSHTMNTAYAGYEYTQVAAGGGSPCGLSAEGYLDCRQAPKYASLLFVFVVFTLLCCSVLCLWSFFGLFWFVLSFCLFCCRFVRC